MNKKIIATLIVLLFCACCLGIASAENSTNGTAKTNENIDLSSYIHPISITDKGIEFSDGSTGFCLNSSKDPVATGDGFESQKTGSNEIQNYVKLAIIEAYRQGSEGNLAKIISSFADGTYKLSNDNVIKTVLKSNETIGDKAVVELEDSVEGDFEFELLKDVKGEKSDCLAYKVSLKEISNGTKNATEPTNNTNSTDGKNASGPTDNKTDNKNATEPTDNKQKQETVVNETNNTIENKTNTVIINENNTTVINKNNVKVINKTNDHPQNATIQNKILRTVGNPIFLLVVVIIIAAVAAVLIRRKGQ